MYSTKHRQSSKRSSRDSDFTNQHQPSLSVTPIVPQQGSHPLPAPPSLRWKPFLEEKATCEESVAAVTRLLDGTDDGISFWKPARSAKSNSGNETTCAVLAWADARPARTCRAPEVQCRRWQPLPVSTPLVSHSSTRASADLHLTQSRLRHDKRTSSIIVYCPDGPSKHLPTSLSFLESQAT